MQVVTSFLSLTQELDDVLIFSQKTVFAGVVSLLLMQTVVADSNQHVKTEPLHPTANLSYKVAGKQYFPQKNAEGFTQSGKASWYGPGFQGRRTASGERFDMNKLTAAHPTLPIPSYVRVTNTKNGKSVVVRINDRGPFHGGRIIDISKAAAQQLGFVNHGTAQVKIERVPSGNIKVATPEHDVVKLDSI